MDDAPNSDALASPYPETHEHKGPLWTGVLGAMGVVFGDIGTSPLYAFKASLDHIKESGEITEGVLGIISLIIWALIITVTLKYILFLMRADNRGEGGTLSLMALAQRAISNKYALPVFLLGIAGTALFSGDAIITPAISVLSAVEGLKIVSPHFKPYILSITVVILVSLFLVQRFGTGRVAAFFGPVMAVFFASLAILGIYHIMDAPQIFHALNPFLGVKFLFSHGLAGFITLGLVFLSVTGAEALYADMGHFGRKPIRIAWNFFVLPSLFLNYLGQGAFVLSNPDKMHDPFYLMVPEWALIPFVLLCTLATVIASQAVITGAYSLVRQAIQLGLLPRMDIRHTSPVMEGQIYVPRANRLLLLGVLMLVFLFPSSDALANAYGIAVTGTMVVTTSLAFFVVWKLWKWPLPLALLFVAFFLMIDIAFLIANLAKVFDGGWVPLLLAASVMVMLWTWVRGARLLERKTHKESIPLTSLIQMLEKSQPVRVSGTAVFLTSAPDTAPSSLMHNLKHNKVLHQSVYIVCVRTERVPRVPPDQRAEVEYLSDGFSRIILHFGYMESPRVPAALAQLRRQGLRFDIMTTSFFLGRRTLKSFEGSDMPFWQDQLFVLLSRQAIDATDFFSIPTDRAVQLGAQVTI